MEIYRTLPITINNIFIIPGLAELLSIFTEAVLLVPSLLLVATSWWVCSSSAEGGSLPERTVSI